MEDLASGPSTSTGWMETFNLIRDNHDKAYYLIEEAMNLEAQDEKDAALAKYIAGLSLIDKALSVELVCPINPTLSWERAGIMVQKMRTTKKEILSRISDLQVSATSTVTSDKPERSDPPSYEEAMGMPGTSGTSETPQPRTYGELAEALNSLQVEPDMADAEILFSHDNVRLYFICPDGTVSSPSEPDCLQIVRFSENSRGNRPPAYLQVGSWIYPLVPGVSPCFRTNYRAFILPDIHSDIEGSAVGIILPEDADESVFELLESILEEIMLELSDEERVGRTRREAEVGFAHSIVRGARFVSSKLMNGAQRASGALNRNTPKLLSHIDVAEQPKTINPNVSKSIQVAKDVTGSAVKVTGFLASSVGSATSALGRFLAPHIQKQGTKLLSNTFKMEETQAKEKMENVLQVTAGAVEAFGTVYNGLEQSAHILGGSLADNTVKVVRHKYGPQAGQVAGDTFDTMGNVMVATSTVKRLTPKNLVKTTAKAAGKAVIEDQRNHLKEHTRPTDKPPFQD